MKKILLLFVILAAGIQAYAQASNSHIQQLLQNVEGYFRGLDGYVVEAGKEPIIDLGANRKATAGLVLTVYREGEPIVHPVSGKLLGAKQSVSGELVVLQVHDEYSTAKVINKFEMQPGDKVALSRPVKIKVTGELNETDRALVKSTIEASSLFIESDDTDFILNIAGGDNNLSCQVLQNGNIVYFDSIVTRVETVTATDQGTTYMNVVAGGQLSKGKFTAITVGRIFKDDSTRYMLAADDTSITIFEIGGEFKEVGKIDAKFNSIAAIDIADMDGDGVDEIFVSNILRKTYAYSSVYKHDGKKFVQVQKGIEFLFRTYTDIDGKTGLIGQKLNSEGGYRGGIFFVDYTNSEYVEGRIIPGTIGKQLLGFTFIPAADENDSRMISIDQAGRLSISTFRKNEYVSSDYFGDTFVRFKPTNTSANNTNEDINLNLVINARPRTIPLSESRYILVQNKLYSRAFSNSPVFSKSNIGIYKFEFAKLDKIFLVDDQDPVIVDVFSFKQGGKTYLLSLATPNTWGIFREASIITQYEINVAD